jgi:hypothetical protein
VNGFEVEYVRPDCGTWSMVGQKTSEFIGRYGVITYPMCTIIQLVPSALDKYIKSGEVDTLNNVMVARKL